MLWKNLTVKGIGSTSVAAKTFPDAVLGTFGPDLYNIVTRFIPQLRLQRHSQTRTLIHNFSGVVRDGEMMLVLGRPGSGCSTFLKAIANNRESFAEVTGDISYGGISASKQKTQFRGEVNYNPEDDKHFASLNVWQTLKFSLLNKMKKREKAEIPTSSMHFLRYSASVTPNTLSLDMNTFVAFPEVTENECRLLRLWLQNRPLYVGTTQPVASIPRQLWITPNPCA